MNTPYQYSPVVVPTPGTRVRATSGAPDPAKRVPCHAILFLARPTNTGRVYIGSDRLVAATFVGMSAWLPAPTATLAPGFSVAHTISPNGLNLADYYIDADNPGDGVIISIIVT